MNLPQDKRQQPVQPQQENIPPTEQFRRTFYEGKRAELDKELKKYEMYAIRSRDLEQLLNLHNFLLQDSFREVSAIYEKYISRLDNVDAEEKEVYERTFSLKFLETALDFFNGFAVRVHTFVPESNQETKEGYSIGAISVLYKGEDNEVVIINSQDLKPVIDDLNKEKVPYEKLKDALLSHEFFVRVFGDIIYSTLMNHQSEYNTITFSSDMKNPTFYNGNDFKKLVLNKTFDKHLAKLEDIQVLTSLVP